MTDEATREYERKALEDSDTASRYLSMLVRSGDFSSHIPWMLQNIEHVHLRRGLYENKLVGLTTFAGSGANLRPAYRKMENDGYALCNSIYALFQAHFQGRLDCMSVIHGTGQMREAANIAIHLREGFARGPRQPDGTIEMYLFRDPLEWFPDIQSIQFYGDEQTSIPLERLRPLEQAAVEQMERLPSQRTVLRFTDRVIDERAGIFPSLCHTEESEYMQSNFFFGETISVINNRVPLISYGFPFSDLINSRYNLWGPRRASTGSLIFIVEVTAMETEPHLQVWIGGSRDGRFSRPIIHATHPTSLEPYLRIPQISSLAPARAASNAPATQD
ncbi:hypothetical protein J4219_00215 [Candidatus Woesearchaeota archaeon]|nr:hypothetical protein [Candidatus Woesearchaeota archaeon]